MLTLEMALCRTPLTKSMWTDSTFLAEEKLDGGRFLLIKVEANRVGMISRGRQIDRIDNFPHIIEAVKQLPDNTVLDCELVSPTRKFNDYLSMTISSPSQSKVVQSKLGRARLFVFDVLLDNSIDLRRLSLKERQTHLDELLAKISCVEITRPDCSLANKYEFFLSLIKKGREGVVLKDLTSPYGYGWAKCKARFDFSVIILGVNQKNSVKLGVYDRDKLIPVGNCTQADSRMIAKIREHPENFVGHVLDVHSFGMQQRALRSSAWGRMRPDLDSTKQEITLEKLRRDASLSNLAI